MSSSARNGGGGGGSGGGVSLAVSSLADERAFNGYHMSSFMAMEVPATIVPRFTMDKVECLGGSFGPFAPNYPVDVPLWLALYLRQTDTCTIQPPDYLRVGYLRDVVEREAANDQGFESLPFYFYEIAKKLTERGGGVGGGSSGGGGGGGADDGDTIPHVVEVIRLVNEIHAMRQQKLKNLMTVFEAEGSPMFIPGVLLTNIVCHELHFLRASFGVVLQQAASMERRRQQVLRLPSVSVATPGRLSSAMAAATLTSGGSSARTTTTLATSSTPGGGTAVSDVASVTGADSFLHDGVPHSQASALTTATSATTAMATTTGGGGTQPEAAADLTALVQPAVKKRRTLRQT